MSGQTKTGTACDTRTHPTRHRPGGSHSGCTRLVASPRRQRRDQRCRQTPPSLPAPRLGLCAWWQQLVHAAAAECAPKPPAGCVQALAWLQPQDASFPQWANSDQRQRAGVLRLWLREWVSPGAEHCVRTGASSERARRPFLRVTSSKTVPPTRSPTYYVDGMLQRASVREKEARKLQRGPKEA